MISAKACLFYMNKFIEYIFLILDYLIYIFLIFICFTVLCTDQCNALYVIYTEYMNFRSAQILYSFLSNYLKSLIFIILIYSYMNFRPLY